MVNNILVEILVNKIRNKEINPNTNKPFCIEDIKIQEYEEVVRQDLNI
ncbi:hypothetical protein [Clostridium tyrobutyricum]